MLGLLVCSHVILPNGCKVTAIIVTFITKYRIRVCMLGVLVDRSGS